MFSKDTLHHAYFIEGERRAVLADIEAFLKDAFSIVREGHPDVHYAEYGSFGIDESRGLQDMQSLRPLTGDKKIFIITLDSITSEAQNSLLKVFEEPTPGTHFFIISSSSRILLPTLKSRMVVIAHSSKGGESHTTDARKFITASIKERFEYISDMVEAKDKVGAEYFLQNLIFELTKTNISEASPYKLKSIKEILTLITYLKDRSSSVKLILERVALFEMK